MRYRSFVFASLLLFLSCFFGSPTHAQQAGGGGVPLSSSVSPNHRISVNDLLNIEIYDEPDLKKLVRVAGDGTIDLHLAGSVSVQGRTVAEAKAAIESAYRERKYLVKPEASVLVAATRPKTFTVLGEVNKPGMYSLPEGTSLSVLEAVGMAGGFNKISNHKIILVRKASNGKVSSMTLDGKKIARGEQATVIIQEGDTLDVRQGIL